MCGRYVLKATLPDIARMLGMDVDLALEPRYNIAPTTEVLACRMETPGEKALARLRWGQISRILIRDGALRPANPCPLLWMIFWSILMMPVPGRRFRFWLICQREIK